VTEQQPVTFVEDPEMISWCPLGAVILGGQKMASLDLRREEDQQRFGEILVENECACPRCFLPHSCVLENIVFARVVARIRCKECGFHFRWYASETAWLVFEGYGSREDVAAGWLNARGRKRVGAGAGRRERAKQMWQGLFGSEFDEPVERVELREEFGAHIGEFRCPICREALLHPIRYRRGFARVVCRNSGCRQQWGFNPKEAREEETSVSNGTMGKARVAV
jgi:transposase-like protein